MINIFKSYILNTECDEEFCLNKNNIGGECEYLKTHLETFIRQPYPKVMTIYFEWYKAQETVTYKDLLMLYFLINQKFNLDELYNIENSQYVEGKKELPEYLIKSIVCYSEIEKEFMSFIKINSSSRKSKWKLYRDSYANNFNLT